MQRPRGPDGNGEEFGLVMGKHAGSNSRAVDPDSFFQGFPPFHQANAADGTVDDADPGRYLLHPLPTISRPEIKMPKSHK